MRCSGSPPASSLTVLSAWREGLNTIAGWLGVRSYPPAVLFAVGILFILAVLLHYSTVISRLSDQNVVLAQRLALLEQELRSSATTVVGVVVAGLATVSPRSTDLRDEIERPLLRLLEDPGDVLADDPHAEHLHAAEQQDDREHGRPALRRVVREEARVQRPREHACAEDDHHEAEPREEPDRRDRERRDPVRREPDELGRADTSTRRRSARRAGT